MKTEQFDMESLFDFNQGTTQQSPITASSSRNDALSPFNTQEERQQYGGPSHDYHQYKQQVGLPVGSMANMPLMRQSESMFDGYNSGIGDMGFNTGIEGWSSGIDIDTDMALDFNDPTSVMPAMFFPPPNNDNAMDTFINPVTIGGAVDEPTSNVGRLWPGIHSQQAQQAAMQKAGQAQAVQQRQMKMQAQHANYRQAATSSQASVSSASQGQGQSQSQSQGQSQSQPSGSKRLSNTADPHVEESISRLLSQMRNNTAGSDDAGSPSDMLPHIARMKKDEEEMDEDERLLASDEGKKLSSKERRQLRNKVSARAFRSRRKGKLVLHHHLIMCTLLICLQNTSANSKAKSP